ncbi:16S rRNA (cytidine(1402)-2'-O)-methyltransferase [bacterium]|nr:16S rRNA (cytidine(1402)-2'-O)-methyltransferase [bacterium]
MSVNLVITPTPIGNLDDITKRSKDTLENADYILAEDTREIKKLLNLLNISIEAPIFSYRDQNHNYAFEKFVEFVDSGEDLLIALVSDRGTPLISDPGFQLVRDIYNNEALSKNVKVDALPGPTALIPAIILSGLPTDRFMFIGFLPRKKSKQLSLIEKFSFDDATSIIYESPFRIVSALELLVEYSAEKGIEFDVALVKDVSKLHEKVYRGNAGELLLKFSEETSDKKPKGEWVVLWRIIK